METQSSNAKGNEFPLNWFKEKEEETIKRVTKVAQDMAKDEMRLFGLELAFATIPKKKIDKINKEVKELREREWEKALKLAKGNETKALTIYDRL